MVLIATVLGITAIVVLTGISAFFSSSELAVFSVAKHRIDSLAAAEIPGSAALVSLREEPHRFLVTALVSNNVANIAAASIATAVLVQFLPAGQAATGATVFTSFFVIVLGEIAPKSYAVANAERHALRVARPVIIIQRLLRPILFIFEVATAAVNRVTGGESGFESYLTREEIETIVLSGEETGVLDTDEGAMIRSVLELDERVIRAVMVPRTAMVTATEHDTREAILDTMAREWVTRVPVTGDTRDEIRGILDVRDVLEADDDTLADRMTEPQFVPGSKPVDEVLTEMQTEGHRMVIVVDEFGTVTGLATLEDVVEEVVGELFSGSDTDPIRVVDADTAVLNGWATIDYANTSLGVSLPTDGPFETVGGLITHHLGRLPSEDDRVELSNAIITVLDATPTRIRRVRLDWTIDASDDTPDNVSDTHAAADEPAEPAGPLENDDPNNEKN